MEEEKPQETTAPDEKSKRATWVIAIIAIVLVIILGTYLFIQGSGTGSEELSPTPAPTEVMEDDSMMMEDEEATGSMELDETPSVTPEPTEEVEPTDEPEPTEEIGDLQANPTNTPMPTQGLQLTQ